MLMLNLVIGLGFLRMINFYLNQKIIKKVKNYSLSY